jgi:hypothetical protein
MRVVPSTPSSLRRSSELSESNASESNTGRSRCPSREPCLVSPPRAPTRVPRGNDRADVPRNVLTHGTTFAPSRVFDSSMPESRNRDRCGAYEASVPSRRIAFLAVFAFCAQSRPVHSLPRSGSG